MAASSAMVAHRIWDPKVAGSSPASPTKPCFWCAEDKPFDAYYKHPTTRDGRMGTCKACLSAKAKAKHAAKLNDRTGDGAREIAAIREVAASLGPDDLQKAMIRLELLKRYLSRRLLQLDGRNPRNQTAIAKGARYAFACALRRARSIRIEP